MILQQPSGNEKKQVVQETTFSYLRVNIQRDANFPTFKSEFKKHIRQNNP